MLFLVVIATKPSMNGVVAFASASAGLQEGIYYTLSWTTLKLMLLILGIANFITQFFVQSLRFCRGESLSVALLLLLAIIGLLLAEQRGYCCHALSYTIFCFYYVLLCTVLPLSH